MPPTPLARRVFPTQQLVEQYPPRLHHPNKHAVYRIACPPGAVHGGELGFTRWAEMELPASLGQHPLAIEHRQNFFTYDSPSHTNDIEWHVNFADQHLFVAYGGGLFAQDEMQVAEHPALGSLLEALKLSDIPPLTTENGSPTPVLVKGVERRCQVETTPDAAAGRPRGLYGNHFSQAPMAVVERATQRIDPPTLSNILAMEAIPGGMDAYRASEIALVLTTAYTGFHASVLESGEGNATIIHTGFWGCGVYGGNRVMMCLLQLLAARMAKVNRVVFHTGDAAGTAAFVEASRLERELASQHAAATMVELVDQIEGLGLRWGVGDGN